VDLALATKRGYSEADDMSIIVKICGITSVGDARVAAEAGANAIGLMFFTGSPRYVPLEIAARIAQSVPPFVARVGVFVNPIEQEVTSAITACGLNILQFHGEETPEFCTQFGVMSMKAFRIRDEASLKALPDYPTDAWLLDAYSPAARGGTGATLNWDLAVEAKNLGRPFFLAGGLTPANVAEAVRRVQPYGVDVSSGVESSPGKKDPEKVRAFVTAAKQAAEQTDA
jgi:phosphoribosylanthranilate isomerase